ncbi:MAG: tRNA (adenosine(37)-N6)-dimethylallyltransferase MiaA [Lachnospiraceae bacterium]
MIKPKLIVLTGPTAVGKTKLSIKLAKALGGEIISADSMQVYKEMTIGSAKIKQEEMDGIPHYLVDLLEPTTDFNVKMFQTYAKQYMKEIYANGNIPIVVGGTGFYIQALVNDIDFSEEEKDDTYRTYLEDVYKKDGIEVLHAMLQEVDHKSSQTIHPNNVKRVMRALEYVHNTKQLFSEHNEIEKQKKSPYDVTYFVLNDKREKLYQRIEKRVDEMIKEGLVLEVTNLKNKGLDRKYVSMQGLGYKEILSYLDGEISLEESVEIIKKETRHFAKRQLTWFRREANVTWINKDEFSYDEEEILQHMIKIINKEDKVNE